MIMSQNQTNLSVKHSKPFLTERIKDYISGYLYISPFFILFGIFGIFPIFFSFYLAFHRWNGIGGLESAEFIGLRNFELIFTHALFWDAFWNTIIIGLMGTAPQIVVGIILAFALNSALIRFRHFFRVAFFMPFITSIVAVALIFSVMFTGHETGYVNVLLSYIGLDPVRWGTTYWGVKIAISVMVFWRWIGYNTIIYLAGLQSIPNDLYEAAKIDGANIAQQLLFITVPLLRPFIIFTVLLATIGSMQLFTEPYIFLQGSTRSEGVTIVMYLYDDAFQRNALGKASATAVILFLIIMVFSAINIYLSNRLGKGGKKKWS